MTAAEAARCADPRLRYLRLEIKGGAAAARNPASAAAAPFLAFQDSDDEWLPDKLERHMDAFAAWGRRSASSSDMHRVRRDGSREYHRSPDICPGC